MSKFDLAKCKIWSLTYDKQGNTINESTSTGDNLFEYNTLNQQVKAVTKENNTLISRYDSEGLRYEIEENQKLSRFIFTKNGDILVESGSEENVVSRFTRGYDLVAADVDEQRYYYSVDEQGSTEFITDSVGTVKNQYRYDAFGNILDYKEEIHNRITYTGQQFDGVTQQYYLRARYYNPIVGRFNQEDVYRGDGLNLYVYCGNNPVVCFDPSGYVRSPKPYRSVVAKGDTQNAIEDALKGINLGKQGDGFVMLKDIKPLDKKAIEVLKKNGLDGIWYRNGRPDFTPVSLFNVEIPNMGIDRDILGGNYDQARKAIAEKIIKHKGNINELMDKGIVSEYATGNTKKTVFKFLKHDAKGILESELSDSKKVERLSKLIEDKFQKPKTNKYTVHEVNTKDVQLVPHEINARFNHDGGVSDCKASRCNK